MLDNELIAFIRTTLLAGLAGTDYAYPVQQAYQPTMQGANTGPTYYLYKIADRRLGWPYKNDTYANVVIANFIGSITGNVLTVTEVTAGTGAIVAGYGISAIGLPPNTLISALGTGTGGVGTYIINRSTTIFSQAMTAGAPAEIHTESCQYETTFQLSALSTQNPANVTQKTASDLLNYAAYVLQSQMSIATFEAQNVGILEVRDVRNLAFKDDRDQNEYGPSFDFVMTHKRTIITTTPILQSEEFQILPV